MLAAASMLAAWTSEIPTDRMLATVFVDDRLLISQDSNQLQESFRATQLWDTHHGFKTQAKTMAFGNNLKDANLMDTKLADKKKWPILVFPFLSKVAAFPVSLRQLCGIIVIVLLFSTSWSDPTYLMIMPLPLLRAKFCPRSAIRLLQRVLPKHRLIICDKNFSRPRHLSHAKLRLHMQSSVSARINLILKVPWFTTTSLSGGACTCNPLK